MFTQCNLTSLIKTVPSRLPLVDNEYAVSVLTTNWSALIGATSSSGRLFSSFSRTSLPSTPLSSLRRVFSIHNYPPRCSSKKIRIERPCAAQSRNKMTEVGLPLCPGDMLSSSADYSYELKSLVLHNVTPYFPPLNSADRHTY